VGLAKEATLGSILPRNVSQWGGTALTGRNITGDLARLQNLEGTRLGWQRKRRLHRHCLATQPSGVGQH